MADAAASSTSTEAANVSTSQKESRSTRFLRLYMVRHGESVSNKWGLLAGQDDVPLTKSGRQEAIQLGKESKYFSTVDWNQLYASDLQRARDTAVLALLAAPEKEGRLSATALQTRVELRERSYGLLQGFSRSTPLEEAKRIWDQYDQRPPVYETDEDLWIRAKAWVTQLVEQVKTSNQLETQFPSNSASTIHHVLMVAHAGVVRELILRLIPDEKYLISRGARFDEARNHRLIIPNTSVTVLEIDLDSDKPLENVKLIDLTNAQHLAKVNAHDD